MDRLVIESGKLEAIRARKSVRNYDGNPIAAQDEGRMESFLMEENRLVGPLGTRLRLERVKVTKDVSDKGIKLGTYGVIRNPQAYWIGILQGKSRRELLDFGYVMEELVLYLTRLGIGTCWLGGTFNRNSFERELELQDGEWIPCITPIGYPKEKKGLLESTMRYLVKADQRKGWEELFYDGVFGTALSEEDAGQWAVPLEMVRLGPSGSNKQPWRVVVSEDRRTVHFYLEHTPRYNDTLQQIDMGIAMCHFETACRELGLEGGWKEQAPKLELPSSGQTEYMISWIGNEQVDDTRR